MCREREAKLDHGVRRDHPELPELLVSPETADLLDPRDNAAAPVSLVQLERLACPDQAAAQDSGVKMAREVHPDLLVRVEPLDRLDALVREETLELEVDQVCLETRARRDLLGLPDLLAPAVRTGLPDQLATKDDPDRLDDQVRYCGGGKQNFPV